MSKAQFEKAVYNRWGDIVCFPPGIDADEYLRGISTPIDIRAESQNPEWPVGTRVIRGNEEFTYAKNGTVAMTVAGSAIQGAAPAHGEQEDDIVVAAIAAIGALTIELTSTANLDTAPNDVADDFKDGYLLVNDADGQGQMHRIKSNEAFSGTDDSTFTLYSALKVALATSSQVGIIRNPFYKTVVTAATLTGVFLGTNHLAAITADYYYWIATRGIVPAVPQAAISMGTMVVVGTQAGKFNALSAFTTEIIVGQPATPGVADTEQFMLKLL